MGVRREGRGKGRSEKKWRGKGGEREGKGGGRGGSERECGGVEHYSPSTSSKGISRLSLHRPERVRGQRSNTATMLTTMYTQLLDGLTLNSLLLSQQTLGHYPSTLWHASEHKREREEGVGVGMK